MRLVRWYGFVGVDSELERFTYATAMIDGLSCSILLVF
jgi:hypothetical protein